MTPGYCKFGSRVLMASGYCKSGSRVLLLLGTISPNPEFWHYRANLLQLWEIKN